MGVRSDVRGLMVAIALISVVPPVEGQDACVRSGARPTVAPMSLKSIQSLAGSYMLRLTWPNQPSTDHWQSRPGPLNLWLADSSASAEYPLAGSTALELPGVVKDFLPVSPQSRDPNAPGVQVTSRGGMIIGNPVGPTRAPAADAGVWLTIARLDSTAFSGTWQLGGLLKPLPHGTFCAWRVLP